MRKFKNWQYLFLFVFLLLSFCFPQMAQAAEGVVPTDLEGHWAAKQITDWTSKSSVGVYPDGTFKPDNNITRAEFIALVNWAFGYTKTSPINFSDVSENDSYYTDIAKAVAVGYMGGYSDGTMKPNNSLTRQEAAAILMKILHPVNTGATLTFVDEIPQWCAGSIDAVVSNGYMSGYPDKTFRPINMLTRAEAISLIARAMGTLYNQEGTYGSAEETTTIPGHVTISQSGVTLKNTVIDGNLYLTEGIGDGHVTLENVQVKGTTQVSGGGENSIIVLNSTLGTVLIDVPDNSKVRLVAQGSTTIGTVQATSVCKLEEENLTGDGFGEVVINIPEGYKVELAGAFQTINVECANAQVDLLTGSIETFTVAPASSGASINFAAGTTVNTFTTNSAAIVTGDGTIQTANINVDGVNIATAPVKHVLAEGVTAKLAGKEETGKVAGAPAVYSGGGGNSSGNSSAKAAPKFMDGYPKIDLDSIGTNSCKVLIKTNKQGHAYYVALPAGAVEPTAQQVREGKGSNNILVALKGDVILSARNNEEDTVTIEGLASDTKYDVYIVADDQQKRLQKKATIVPVETKAIPVSSITINEGDQKLVVGDQIQLTTTFTPENPTNQNVTWESNNETVATVDDVGMVTAVSAGEATIKVTTEDGLHTDDIAITVSIAGTIVKTVYWGTPDNVLYYFELVLGNEYKIGDLSSLQAKAYDGATLISTISLKQDQFEEYKDNVLLGGSFRSNPEASPSSSWNLQAFDGTMPTKILVSYVIGGKTYEFGSDEITWGNEGYKKISNTTQNKGYDTIHAALAEVKDEEEILVAAGTYELNQKLSINNKITISGKGEVILSVSSDLGTDNSSKHAIGIYSDNVTINNFTIDNNNKAYGVQAYKATGVKLNEVTIIDSKGAGLTVNGSNVTATNLSTSGNLWGAVNVDPGSGVILPSSFTLVGQSNLVEDTQIWSDGKNVSDDSTVTVNAQGYNEYYVGESENGRIWTNKELRNVAIMNKDKKIVYQTIQGAIDDADENDEILVAPGTYDVTYVKGTTKHYLRVNKPVTIKAADMEDKPVLIADYNQVKSQAGGQQQTVFVTADNVTLDGLIIHSITDYPTNYTKVIEIENANYAVIKNCELYDEGRTAIYLGGTKVGKYTIEDNILDGAIVIANGAGNGDNGDESIIKGNTINASISFTGRTNSGWDPNSIEHYPTIEGNKINGTSSAMLINSRDIASDKLISDDLLDSIINNNIFPNGDVRIVRDSYEYYGSETHRKRLMLNPPVYNENLKTYHMSIQDAIDAYENAENGDYTIIIKDGTYNEDGIVIKQQVGKSLTIKSESEHGAILVNDSSVDSTGIFHVSGGSNYDTGAVTFEGIRFELPAGDEVNCFGIKLLSGTADRYASNVTVRNCEFIGNVEKSCAVWSGAGSQPKNILIEGCKGDGLTALYNGYGSGITIKESELANARGLLNSQSTDSANELVIENVKATIDYEPSKDMHAIRFNGGHLTVNNSEIRLDYNGASCESGLIVVRKNAKHTVQIINSTLTTNKVGGEYDVYTFYGTDNASRENTTFLDDIEGFTYGGNFALPLPE